jgi:hypothetical protein
MQNNKSVCLVTVSYKLAWKSALCEQFLQTSLRMTMVSMEVLLSKQAGFQIADATTFFTPSPPTCLPILQYFPLGLHHMQYTSCQYQ